MYKYVLFCLQLILTGMIGWNFCLAFIINDHLSKTFCVLDLFSQDLLWKSQAMVFFTLKPPFLTLSEHVNLNFHTLSLRADKKNMNE